jgi:glycosyltransferase involved in cell wall biosynthesis
MFLDDLSDYEQDYPWREDPTLSKDRLPDWIRYYPVKPTKFDYHYASGKFGKMIHAFSKCDVALVNSVGAIIAMKAKVPYFFYSLGNCLDMAMIGPRISKGLINLLYLQKPVGLFNTLTIGFLQRRAIRNANLIGIVMGYQVDTHAKYLGILDKIKLIRLPWDIKMYEYNFNKALQEKYDPFDLVYFMPTRHVWASLWKSDFCKGNDKFIKAFAKLLQEKKPNARLVCVDKGPDVSHSKALIDELGIGDYIEWIEEIDKGGIKMYNSLDNVVIVDQFGHDDWKQRWPHNDKFGIGFSAIGFEAMSAKNILISTFTDTQFYADQFPPMFEAFSIDDIYRQLIAITELTKEERENIGEQAYQFFYNHHNWDSATDVFIEVLMKINAQ